MGVPVMNIFVDENQTQRTTRTDPIKPQEAPIKTKRFGQTVHANKIRTESRSQQTTKSREEPRRKRKKTSKREPEICHRDTFDREKNLLSSLASSESNFWSSNVSAGGLFKRNYSPNVDVLLKNEFLSFGLQKNSDFGEDMMSSVEDFAFDLEPELDSIDDLIAGL